MLLIEATRIRAVSPPLPRAFGAAPRRGVAEGFVTQPLGPVLARHREVCARCRERLRVEGGVAEVDLSDLRTSTT